MYFKIIILQERISVKILNKFIILSKTFQIIFCRQRSFILLITLLRQQLIASVFLLVISVVNGTFLSLYLSVKFASYTGLK